MKRDLRFDYVMSIGSLIMIFYHIFLGPDTHYSTKSMIFFGILHIISDIRLTIGRISITAMVMPQIQKATDEARQSSTDQGSTPLDKEEGSKS